jgi:hypothetical protein
MRTPSREVVQFMAIASIRIVALAFLEVLLVIQGEIIGHKMKI